MSDRYKQCPLQEFGFTLVQFHELATRVFGPDGKCICTETCHCPNVDKRDRSRCSIAEMEKLDQEAIRRRAWQSDDNPMWD